MARDKVSNPLREPIANPRNGLSQVSSFGFVFEDVEETFESCFLLSFYLIVKGFDMRSGLSKNAKLQIYIYIYICIYDSRRRLFVVPFFLHGFHFQTARIP